MTPERKPSVLVISSRVVRGSVGGRASQFALETMGFPVWSLSTVELAWHPGHGASTRMVPGETDFGALLDDLLKAPWISDVGAVLTGYFANRSQVELTSAFIRELKSKNRDICYACDPVLGDDGGLYVQQEIATGVRDLLVPVADIATPNQFELAFLAGKQIAGNLEGSMELARCLASKTVLVTSCETNKCGRMGNLLCTDSAAFYCDHEILDNSPKGSGDLTAAVFLANRLSGLDNVEAIKKTTSSVLEVLGHSVSVGADELVLENAHCFLLDPSINLEVSGL